MKYKTITVGELRQELEGLEDSVKISFSGGLSFSGLKRWGDNEFIVEFEEAIGYLPERFEKENPHVKVVFINTEYTDWYESGTVGKTDISVR